MCSLCECHRHALLPPRLTPNFRWCLGDKLSWCDVSPVLTSGHSLRNDHDNEEPGHGALSVNLMWESVNHWHSMNIKQSNFVQKLKMIRTGGRKASGALTRDRNGSLFWSRFVSSVLDVDTLVTNSAIKIWWGRGTGRGDTTHGSDFPCSPECFRQVPMLLPSCYQHRDKDQCPGPVTTPSLLQISRGGSNPTQNTRAIMIAPHWPRPHKNSLSGPRW